MKYADLLIKLLNVNMHGGIKLGLDNVLHLNALLGNPAETFDSIHIAGTNGKGSVSTKIAAALQEAMPGSRIGLFTSPHIACFRERIRINGEMIPESAIERLLPKIFETAEKNNIPATFFEITTLLAFLYFAEQKIDVAVIETGLGGRFDATNIVKTKLSIITSISLEHTEYLGSTLDGIAFEKAGIIKPNIPVVLGPRLPIHVFETIANNLHCPLRQVTGSFETFFKENEAIARLALEWIHIPENAISKGLQALPPCRIEEVLPNVILDVAHNPDGMEQLVKALKNRYPSQLEWRFVIGISKSKDIEGCLRWILANATHIHLVEATNGRAATSMEVYASLKKLGADIKTVSIEPSITEGVLHAVQAAKATKELVIVCGTFFIMEEARRALGLKEPRDPTDLNERPFTSST